MQLGMIGLGRMGANMVRRLMKAGHECVVFDMSPASVQALAKEGAQGGSSLDDFIGKLKQPRAIWLMVPAAVVDSTLAQLLPKLQKDDILIDGGNSYYIDDIRRGKELAPKGIHYVDVGTSGGVWGLERGYCMMIGGEQGTVQRLDPIFKSLAPGRGDIARTPGREKVAGTSEEGYLHCGPSGAGHFVKMVHNGIEYGVMASWLLDLTAIALLKSPALDDFSGRVSDSGEGRWTIQAAIEEGTPAPVLTSALFERFTSRGESDFANKLLSAMRFEFGGHHEKKS